jgi:AcrR family transcriptional regulator
MIRTSNQPPTRRQRKRDARIEDVLDAAMHVIVGEGLSALTIAHLAEELDTGVGSLYRYFPGKAELLLALQLRAIAQLGAHLQAQVSGDDALSSVVSVFRGYASWAVEAPARYSLVETFMADQHNVLSDDDAVRVQEATEPLLGLCTRLLEEAAAAGQLNPGDARTRTHVIWAALHGAMQFRKRDPRQPPSLHARALVDEALRALLAGWGAGSPTGG